MLRITHAAAGALLLVVGWSSGAAGQADPFLPDAFSVTGTWIVEGPAENVAGECLASGPLGGTPLCDTLYGMPVMRGRDSLYLEPTSFEQGELATPFATAPHRAVRVVYDGLFAHYHGYVGLDPLDGELQRYAVCGIADYAYPGTGELIYDLVEERIWFSFRGETTATPIPDHNAVANLSSERKGIPELGIDGEITPLFADALGGSIVLDYDMMSNRAGTLTASCDVAMTDPGSIRLGGGRLIADRSQARFVRSVGLPPDLRGAIEGTVRSAASGLPIERAVVELRVQYGNVRTRTAGETLSDYLAYLEGASTVVTRQSLGEGGSFAFPNLPALGEYETPSGTRLPVRRIRYAVVVRSASTDVDPAVFGVPVVYFASAFELNVSTFDAPLDIVLDPVSELAGKRAVIERLRGISPNNYASAEAPATAWIDGLSGSGTLSDVEIEALRRGINAERIVADGAEAADESIGLGLTAVGTLLGNIFDELPITESGAVVESRAFRNSVRESGGRLTDDQAARFGIDTTAPGFDFDAVRWEREWPALRFEILSKLGAGLKTLRRTLFAQLRLHGVDPGDAERWAMAVETVLRVMMESAASGSLVRGSRLGMKALIEALPRAFQPVLFDNRLPAPPFGDVRLNALPSYCSDTRAALASSTSQMTGWSTADLPTYLAAAERAHETHGTINREAAQVAADFAFYQTLVGDTADFAESAFGLVDRIPVAKALAFIAKLVKLLSSLPAISRPFEFALGRAPQLVEQGVADAFGDGTRTSPAPIIEDPPTPAGPGHPLSVDGDLDVALTIADTSLTTLSTAARENRIGDAMAETQRALDALRDAERVADRMLVVAGAAAAVDGAGAELLAAEEEMRDLRLDLMVHHAAFVEHAQRFYADVLTGRWERPLDPEYAAARRRLEMFGYELVDDVEALRDRYAAHATEIEALLPAAPAQVVVEVEALEAEDGSGPFVDATGDTFELRARVRNVGANPAAAVGATLEIAGAPAAVSIDGPSAQTIGDLAPDDGAPDGSDERVVTWTVRQDAAPGDSLTQLTVRLTEGGAAPASFEAHEATAALVPDRSVVDADLDLLPDSWERAHGLDTSRDDALDDTDGDGLDNLTEHRFELDPSAADTDSDGLSDGEEISGGDRGLPSDPRVADTDADGTDDAADGAPADPDATDAAIAVSDPVVDVDRTSIDLTRDASRAFVLVRNAGGGTLEWTARPDDEAIAIVNVDGRETSPAGLLEIRTPPGYDFASLPVRTTVRVLDATGRIPDAVEIEVWVSNHGERPMPDAGVVADAGALTDGGPGDTPAARDGDGCGCRTAGRGRGAALPGVLLVLGAMWFGSRRAGRQRRGRSPRK